MRINNGVFLFLAVLGISSPSFGVDPWVNDFTSYSYPNPSKDGTDSMRAQYLCSSKGKKHPLDEAPFIGKITTKKNAWYTRDEHKTVNHCNRPEVCFLARLLCQSPIDTLSKEPVYDLWGKSKCYQECRSTRIFDSIYSTNALLKYWENIEKNENFNTLIDETHLNVVSYVNAEIQKYLGLQAMSDKIYGNVVNNKLQDVITTSINHK